MRERALPRVTRGDRGAMRSGTCRCTNSTLHNCEAMSSKAFRALCATLTGRRAGGVALQKGELDSIPGDIARCDWMRPMAAGPNSHVRVGA